MPKSSADKVRGWVPFYDEFVKTRNILILAFCTIAVLVAIVIGLHFNATESKLTLGGQTVWMFFFLALLLNAGIGVGVSLLISTIVLRDQRFEVQLDLDRRIEGISENVLNGVLAMNLPAEYARLATRVVLTAPIVRRDLDVKITMLSRDDLDQSPRKRRYTILETRVSSTHENISMTRQPLPVSVMLPNPIVPAARKLVRLKKAIVGADALTSAEIKALNEQAQLQLDDPSIPPEILFPIGDVLSKRTKNAIALDPGTTLTFDFEYDIVKEEEDNELILTALPTQSISLSVNDKTGRNLVLMAKSIHTAKLGPDARPVVHDGWAEWKLRDWVFPRQGVIFWWKLPPWRAPAGADLPAGGEAPTIPKSAKPTGSGGVQDQKSTV